MTTLPTYNATMAQHSDDLPNYSDLSKWSLWRLRNWLLRVLAHGHPVLLNADIGYGVPEGDEQIIINGHVVGLYMDGCTVKCEPGTVPTIGVARHRKAMVDKARGSEIA